MSIAVQALMISVAVAMAMFGLCAGHSLNEIDKCWRRDGKWAENRMDLADCAVGFGSNAKGGKGGQLYVVTSDDDHDPANPKKGTLRHAVTRDGPLWIVFARDMNIRLKMPLFVSSHKTIDGRGATVHIADGPCIRLSNVSNVIIQGLHIHDCAASEQGNVLMQTEETRTKSCSVQLVESQDGDGISVVGSTDIWIDHNTMWSCADGLVDVTLASTRITISNNRFSHHDKVILLGHSDDYSADSNMKVTLAFNHFGPGLIERMPRVRYGYAHVANNYYEPWGIYAIGGSSHPTIRSEGNYFVAPNEEYKKQVTWREGCPAGTRSLSSCSPPSSPSGWLFKSVRDAFVNGATFVPSGRGRALPLYASVGTRNFKVARGALVPRLTSSAGALRCDPSKACLP